MSRRPPNTALQRTRSAPLRSPLSLGNWRRASSTRRFALVDMVRTDERYVDGVARAAASHPCHRCKKIRAATTTLCEVFSIDVAGFAIR